MPETTRYPHVYRWRDRFPNAARVLAGQHGAMYAAEDLEGKALWLIKDESTGVDFVLEGDCGPSVALTRYATRDRARWAGDIVELRRRHGDKAGATGERQASPVAARLTKLVDMAAQKVALLAQRTALKAVNERDHLQPCCAAAARDLAGRWTPQPVVSTQRGVEFSAWPRLGNVDVTLQWPQQPPALLELKCGAGLNALGGGVWDAAKLTFALQCDKTRDAFLLAAAPKSAWDRPIRGAEFFTAASHDSTLLRVLYGDWWRQWEMREDPQPTELPRGWQTEHVHTASFDVGGTPWQLRLARVVAADVQRIPWPFLTPDASHGTPE